MHDQIERFYTNSQRCIEAGSAEDRTLYHGIVDKILDEWLDIRPALIPMDEITEASESD